MTLLPIAPSWTSLKRRAPVQEEVFVRRIVPSGPAAFLTAMLAAGSGFAQGGNAAEREAADKTLGSAILTASVGVDGTLVHGSGAVSAQTAPALGASAVVVTFSRNVEVGRCALSATALDFHADKHFVAIASASGQVVVVKTFEGGTGVPAAAPFHLIVVCNR